MITLILEYNLSQTIIWQIVAVQFQHPFLKASCPRSTHSLFSQGQIFSNSLAVCLTFLLVSLQWFQSVSVFHVLHQITPTETSYDSLAYCVIGLASGLHSGVGSHSLVFWTSIGTSHLSSLKDDCQHQQSFPLNTSQQHDATGARR